MLVPKLLMNKFSSCTTVAQISPVAPYHALCFIKKKNQIWLIQLKVMGLAKCTYQTLSNFHGQLKYVLCFVLLILFLTISCNGMNAISRISNHNSARMMSSIVKSLTRLVSIHLIISEHQNTMREHHTLTSSPSQQPSNSALQMNT